MEDRSGPATANSGIEDRALAMVTALSAEVAVLRERLQRLEYVAEQRALFTAESIDGYQPDDAQDAALTASRRAFVDRVFAVLRA